MRNPYITGAYVTGHRHYGRQELMDYLLTGDGCAYWVIGNRRIGKTSLLRQLEQRALAGELLLPLYWDMQGCSSFAELSRYLIDAISDAAPRFTALDISVEGLRGQDALSALSFLRRATMQAGRQLTLLCDETEVLIQIAGAESGIMQRFHALLTSGTDLRVVMTSTRAIYRLHDVCADWPTSPFLYGFDMSQTLGSLSPRSARALITQAQAPEAERVQAAPDIIEAIAEYTNGHPYLLQFLCTRLFQRDGWLRPVADEDLHPDQMLAGFFKNDFSYLTEADRRLVWAAHEAGMVDEAQLLSMLDEKPAEAHQRLHHLERLGYLRRVYGQCAIGNQFLENWLTLARPPRAALPEKPASEAALHDVLNRQRHQEQQFLSQRLNAKRDRLVDLEAVRAEQLLEAPPEVLAEISQLQADINHLNRLVSELQSIP